MEATTYNDCVNSKRKGSFAVGEAIAHFIGLGNTVLLPVSDCDKYDLAVESQGDIQRVQCKYSDDKEASGAYIVELRTFGGYRDKTRHIKYIKDDFDYLFVYCSNKEKYLIPAEEVIGKSKLSVGKKSWRQYLIQAGLAE